VPLLEGTDRKTTEANFHELKAAGYPPKQRVAIVLAKRREALKKKRKKEG
jgi:hypothetical protein